MQRQSKSEQLYERLKRKIQSGHYPAGSRLAPETGLAAELGVSRWTLRPALARLEAEGLLSRSQKRGTTIRSNQHQPPLTLLLPCPEHLLQTSYTSLQGLMQLFSGLMAGASASGCPVETLPVSQDNHPRHLDWQRLNRLDANSRVIVSGFWYEYLFDFLLERGCRVCIIDNMTYKHRLYLHYLEHWQVFELEMAAIMQTTVAHLYNQGCRRLALASAFVNEPEQPTTLEFWRSVLHYGLTPCCLQLLRDEEAGKTLAEELRNFHRISRCDGLIVECLNIVRPHPCINYKQHLGLPDSVRLITIGDCEENQSCDVSGYEFRIRDAGFRMAQLLAMPEFSPGRHRVGADLYCRASSLLPEAAINP